MTTQKKDTPKKDTPEKDIFTIEYSSTSADINENRIFEADAELLSILLKDNTTQKNILWMTDNYQTKGHGYKETSEITIERITGRNGSLIKPRINKSKAEQLHRSRDKAEVFTPSWICNQQNNLIDTAWFGHSGTFNTETDTKWLVNPSKISFPEGKTWKDYVLSTRLEITCGEAPYLVSRYDTTTGEMLQIPKRIGLLDRKLRVVCENADSPEEWQEWTIKAFQNVYGYEWQGDSLLLARENLLLTFLDYYKYYFKDEEPKRSLVLQIANIISWNLWQMDGMKFVVPLSCHVEKVVEIDLFSENVLFNECEGCKCDKIDKHNGIYCIIMDWEKNKKIKAVSLLKC